VLEAERKHFSTVRHVSGRLDNCEQALLVVDGDDESLEKIVGKYSVGFATLKCKVRPVVEGDNFVIHEIKTGQSKLDVLEKFHLDIVVSHALRRGASFRIEAKFLSDGSLQRCRVCARVQDEPERTRSIHLHRDEDLVLVQVERNKGSLGIAVELVIGRRLLKLAKRQLLPRYSSF
jgi:hypothetical protein